MGILNTTITIIIIVVVGLLFADMPDFSMLPIIFIILISALPISIIILMLRDYNKRTKNYISNTDIKRVKILAQDFLNSKKRKLDDNDYKEFYNLVKQHDIKVLNDYSTDVPYCIREILYSVYLKECNK